MRKLYTALGTVKATKGDTEGRRARIDAQVDAQSRTAWDARLSVEVPPVKR